MTSWHETSRIFSGDSQKRKPIAFTIQRGDSFMYKILNSQGLGVAGRQNELIELALTHNFSGVEVDIVDLVGRHDALGKEFACQFLQSAKIDMGTFCLPANLGGTQEEFETSIANLETIIDLANTLNAKQCYVKIERSSKTLTFQENFEQHQSRLREIGEALEPHGIKIGVALQASTGKEPEDEFKFVQSAEEILPLVKTISQDNVGLALDCWEWVVGGGTVDQLKDQDLCNKITEVRLADVVAGSDMSSVSKNDRTKLPADEVNSFSFQAAKALCDAGYSGPMSVGTSLSSFSDGSRDKIVGVLSKQLDQIIAGEDPAAILAAAAAAIADEAAADGEAADDGDKSGDKSGDTSSAKAAADVAAVATADG
jgi:sugar phosphate isomerase/epimerase